MCRSRSRTLAAAIEDLDDVVRDASGKARVIRQHFAFDWGGLDAGDIGQQICDACKIEQRKLRQRRIDIDQNIEIAVVAGIPRA